MRLKKQQDLRKIRCKYGLRSVKHYTFLTNDELADSLEEGDLVVVDSQESLTIVHVVDETDAPLSDSINYKHIIRKL